jgi:hypothetical protein
MRKLTRADIRGPHLYAAIRDDLRKRIIELKKLRRVSVGPQVSIVFENRATMIFQVEEMCRAENISEPDKIQDELDIYNKILPDEHELGATLLVEIQDEAAIASTLERLVGLQDHVWLQVGDARVRAEFDPEQFAQDRLAAVQYIKFPLDATVERGLRAAETPVSLLIDHPNYDHAVRLSEDSRASLASDLD